MPSYSSKEPFCERYSHAFGMVWLYAPSGDPKYWHERPWKLETERGGEDNGPIRERLKSHCLMDAYNSPGLIYASMRFK